MKFDISKIKAALKDAGHLVSEGEQWLASDLKQLEDFAYRMYGVAKLTLHYGLSYPSELPCDFPGHPSSSATPTI